MANNNSKTIKDMTFAGVGNLVRLLPTGTVFLFQFLNPVLTNNGHCHPLNKYFSATLTAICGLSCFLSSFTDSYTDSNGNTHYGIATMKGLWPSSSMVSSSDDLSKYKLRFGDFVHAFFSLTVFGVVALLDSNTVDCFYPGFESTGKTLLMAAPPVIGAVSGSVFMLFPSNRHGIGYPSSPSTDES
ncbi:hypothetical protein ACSBR2_031226 [Camellia fascicularis]